MDRLPLCLMSARARRRSPWLSVAIALMVLSNAGLSTAQLAVRPGDERLEVAVSDGEPGEEEIDYPAPGWAVADETGLVVSVRAVEIVGSTVYDETDFRPIVQPFLDRKLDSAGLTALVQAVTRLYVEGGFVSSGAVLPDQDLGGGVVILHVVEGHLGEVRVEGTSHFTKRYFADRLRHAGRAPVQIDRLTDQIAEFQRDPRIARVHASLEAGSVAGESRLVLVVAEASQIDAQLNVSNERPPSVGMTGGGLDLSYSNFVGHGESLSASFRFSEGLRQYRVETALPITARGTELRAVYQRSEAAVVNSAFRVLDIDARSDSFQVELHQALIRKRSHDLNVALLGSWTRWRATVGGRETCFRADQLDCNPVVTALRARQEFIRRTPNAALLIRSTFSFGLDALDATEEGDSGLADGEFFTWLGQVRYLHRLEPERKRDGLRWLDRAVISFRGDVQLANDPLLSGERISVGGPQTVRGFQRNRLVRDNAVIGSLELRFPVIGREETRPTLEIAPFVDVAHAWNDRGRAPVRTISSAGLGIGVNPGWGLHARASWAYPIRRGVDEGEGLQRDGLYMELIWDVF
ncbi:MAG: ShlB/FhaC/HecB family hemolysin secretion/activation protein [bacterium]|nr:ShlB/FhaC/HecB family hemolysin secretion/activation protein [bacterium]